METQRALRWAAFYTLWWLLATVVGLAVVAVGVALGGLYPLGLYGYTPGALRVALFPRAGLAVVVLGLVAWQFGTAAAFLKTLVDATETEALGQLNTEALKSDILSVLDDRLADIHHEAEQTRQLVGRLSRDDAASDFEFGEE